MTGSAEGAPDRPSAASGVRRALAEARFEAGIMLRNGEQLLVALVLPALALVGLTRAPWPGLGPHPRIDVVAPGVLALAVVSSAFTAQAIQTGFDRRYGVLRQLGTTPLGSGGLLAGKAMAVLVVLAVQVIVLGGLALLVGLVATLGMGIFLAFRRKPVGVVLAVVYAAFEGLFVGAISQSYGAAFDPPGTPIFESIVVQAVLATLCVFGAMLLLYSTGIIKVTQKFRAIVGMMTLGYFVFALINLGYALFFGGAPFGIGGSGLLGIGISLFATGLAAVNLAIDFDNISLAIRTQAPVNYGWTLALGLVITVLAYIGQRKDKRGETVSTGLAHGVGGLALINIAVATLLH